MTPTNPLSRYAHLPVVEAPDGTLSLARRPMPTLAQAAPPDSLLHTVMRGDTLDALAFRYYGRADLWWRIADANPDVFPLDLVPGTVLRVPPLRLATQTVR